MSSYYNSFKDGPNDKPPEKKPVRTDHITWGGIMKDVSKQFNPTDKKVKKALKEAGV